MTAQNLLCLSRGVFIAQICGEEALVHHKCYNSALQDDSCVHMARVRVCQYWLTVSLYYSLKQSMTGLAYKVVQRTALMVVRV